MKCRGPIKVYPGVYLQKVQNFKDHIKNSNLNWKRSRFLDKLFTAHFSFRFDSYRQCLCFSVEALTRETQGTKTWGERDRERGITGGEWTERRERVKKRGRRSRREPSGLSPRSPLYPPKTGARGGFYDQRRKTRGRAVPKSDQVLVALRLLWISGWAWTTCCSNERNVLCTMLFGAYQFLSGWCSLSSLLAAGFYVKSQQVSLVNHRPFISFALEVAVENLLHQRSVLATAVQQTREEGGTRRKNWGKNWKKERAEPGEDEKDWGLTEGKLKQRRGSDVGGTTLPHRRLPLRAADSRNRRRRRREREIRKERTDRQKTRREKTSSGQS